MPKGARRAFALRSSMPVHGPDAIPPEAKVAPFGATAIHLLLFGKQWSNLLHSAKSNVVCISSVELGVSYYECNAEQFRALQTQVTTLAPAENYLTLKHEHFTLVLCAAHVEEVRVLRSRTVKKQKLHYITVRYKGATPALDATQWCVEDVAQFRQLARHAGVKVV